MSEIPRYIPVESISFEELTVPLNASTVNQTRSSTFLSEVIRMLSPSATPIAILSIVLLAVLAVLYMLTMWYGKEVFGAVRYVFLRRVLGREGAVDTVDYIYTGIKMILRRYYLKLRESVGCRRCTPREIAERYRNADYEEFARVYEDVVYGSKEIDREMRKVVVKLDDSI